ncbi:MAG TPA: hypothetical protein PKW24_08510 [Clostridiales bacterium]|nr:hypothetical protein [Clostridiales bacterium]
MKTELYKYKVTPGIIKVGGKTSVKISALEPQLVFEEDKKYKLEVWCMTKVTYGDFASKNNVFLLSPINGELVFDFEFDTEAEYQIRVYKEGSRDKLFVLSVYAVMEDLFELRPLKGDFHVHSCRSDGKEHPAVVAANYRKAGFDFVPLTDHLRYSPSIEAQDAYKDLELGMLIINGEEVHSPENYVHVVNFGSESSVNSLFEDDTDPYYEEVEEIIKTRDIPYEDKFVYAANLWVVEKIKERGGLAIFCHPHWISDTYNVPDGLTRAFLKEGFFDAFELIGGNGAHENNMQTAFYYQLRGEGINPPITGASDSHGTINKGLFNKMFTIVFAKEKTKESIMQAVKDYQTVAVEVYEDSVNYTVHGSYRLVSYARYLLEYYFPLTQKIAEEEGILMRNYLFGDEESGARLAKLKNKTDDFYKEFSGK